MTGERITRRFRKEETVQILYDFIESMGDKVQFEHTAGNFVIMQSMPRKVYTEKEKTIGEAGLFPRAMLQVKEEEE